MQIVFDLHKTASNPRILFSIRVDPKNRTWLVGTRAALHMLLGRLCMPRHIERMFQGQFSWQMARGALLRTMEL